MQFERVVGKFSSVPTDSTRVAAIMVCSDPIMASEREQASNRRWLRDILERPIYVSTGIRPTTFFSSLVDESRFSRQRFFALSGMSPNLAADQLWYDDRLIEGSSLSYLREFIRSDALLVGYELSAQTRRILSRIGVPYIDIWLHPVRYLDDILFAFNSNQADVQDRLRSFDLEPEYFFTYASRLRVQFYKGYSRPDMKVPPGSALFVGQMLNDKSVIDSGYPKSVLDYKAQFARIAREATKVYYSRHPYLRRGDEQILRYVMSFPNVELARHPSYSYLCHPNIVKVATVSSSVGTEARYFGKKVEFLFQPMIALGRSGNDYVTVFQSLVSPAFWANILSPIMKTVPNVPDVTFLDKRDKLRDMLAFYWSYQHVDKLEGLRQQFLASENRTSRQSVLMQEPAKEAPYSARLIFDEFSRKLDAASVVSFDLFDTLVTRDIFDPADVPRRINLALLADQHGKRIDQLEFIRARQDARRVVVSERAQSAPAPQEVPLRNRYEAAMRALKLPVTAAEDFELAEEEADLALLRPYAFVRELFQKAIASAKPVVIVSDTYYRRQMIERVLAKAGIRGYRRLYISSEVGKTKHSGDLFKYVAADLGRAPGEILHVGDNLKSDGENAVACGWSSVLVPSPSDVARRAINRVEASFGDVDLDMVGRALIRNALYRVPDPPRQISHTGGDPFQLGYSLFGPLVLGFAKWLLDRAAERNVRSLLFLARDGRIVFRVCEVIARHYPRIPRMNYVYCSRRGVSVPLLRTERDVMHLAHLNFSPCRLGSLLESRFGLLPVDVKEDMLKAGGFATLDVTVRVEDLDKLKRLLRAGIDRVLSIASDERKHYLEYLKPFVEEGQLTAVVDIGHQGTLQRNLSRLLDAKSLGGFYFATHDPIKKNLSSSQFYDSFLVHELPQTADHFYNRFILMFEQLFLNDEGSFIRIVRHGPHLVPHLRDTKTELDRIKFAKDLHAGAEQFARDFVSTSPESIAKMRCQSESLAAPLIELFSSPEPLDAGMFEGLPFENNFAGRPLQYLIAPADQSPVARAEKSVWKEGLASVASLPTLGKAPTSASDKSAEATMASVTAKTSAGSKLPGSGKLFAAAEKTVLNSKPVTGATEREVSAKVKDQMSAPLDLRPRFRLADRSVLQNDGHVRIGRGNAGHGVFGPYLGIAPGPYRVVLELTCEDKLLPSWRAKGGDVAVDVTINDGKEVLARSRVSTSDLRKRSMKQELDFVVPAGADLVPIELRVWTDGKSTVLVREALLTPRN